MSAVVLRLFTGPHMGAELVLEPGDTVLGSSLDCDIILQDSSVAPRHLRLTVTENPTSVRVLALEGQAVVDGTPLAADAELPPRTPCFVGLTCLAWATPTDDAVTDDAVTDDAVETTAEAASPDLREAWDEVALALRAVLHPTSSATTAERAEHADNPNDSDTAGASGETPGDGGPGDETDSAPADPASSEAAPETDTGPTANKVLTLDTPVASDATLKRLAALSAQRNRSRRNRRICLLLFLLLALSGLVFKTHDELNKPQQSIENIQEILAEAGFSTLEVANSEQGPRISGRLPDDHERGRLVRLVQRMHLPVYLNVQVDGDMIQALRMAFNSRELFPKVWAERDGDAMNLHVSGYMKDGVVEAWALAGAKEDLPWLGAFLQSETEPAPGKLVRSILYADGVEPVLRSALDAAGIGTTQINYLPGSVEISGVFDVEARTRLDRVLADVIARLGVPVVFQVREGLPQLPQAVAGKSTGMHPDPAAQPQTQPGTPSGVSTGAPAAPQKSPSAFRVTGVTMSPMRFITLESGERIFEGGMLPGGYTLETISQSRLTLRRDGHTTTLTLRGSDDQ